MSLGLPIVGTVVLGMALWLLDHVTGEREPTPWRGLPSSSRAAWLGQSAEGRGVQERARRLSRSLAE